MSDLLLFDELFIEYIQTLFFKHPEKPFVEKDIAEVLPDYYKGSAMVIGAIHILLMRGMIKPVGDESKWIASKEAMADIAETKRIEKATEEVDLKLKELTKSNFYVPRNLSIISVCISFFAFLAAAANVILTLQKNKEPSAIYPPTYKKIIYTMPISQKDSLNPRQKAGKKDSLNR